MNNFILHKCNAYYITIYQTKNAQENYSKHAYRKHAQLVHT